MSKCNSRKLTHSEEMEKPVTWTGLQVQQRTGFGREIQQLRMSCKIQDGRVKDIHHTSSGLPGYWQKQRSQMLNSMFDKVIFSGNFKELNTETSNHWNAWQYLTHKNKHKPASFPEWHHAFSFSLVWGHYQHTELEKEQRPVASLGFSQPVP